MYKPFLKLELPLLRIDRTSKFDSRRLTTWLIVMLGLDDYKY